MIPEIKTQLDGVVPDAIICSVGGGGMISGIILGCQAAGWDKGESHLTYLTLTFNFVSAFIEDFVGLTL